MHLLSCLDAQMGSPKIHLHCPSYSRHSQWPAGISYLLQEGLQVGLIGLPAQRLSPTYYPFQARGPVTANMAVGGHERQDGSWWPPYRAPPVKEAGSESLGERPRPLRASPRCRQHPNHETNASMGVIFGKYQKTQTRCQHLLSLSASISFYDFEALTILYKISRFIIVEHPFPF